LSPEDEAFEELSRRQGDWGLQGSRKHQILRYAENVESKGTSMTDKEALAQPEQEPVAVYGYCPECGAKGVQRERRPNGNDKCANGHTYPSSKAAQPAQRTEQNFCPRCGKRTKDLTHIHTCTPPPQEKT
jgi:ssDNA-binding Zn-finger/Zn-ribbon topoisomerase 1